MEGKKVSESSVVMVQTVNAQDANAFGIVHASVIVKLINSAASAAGMKHTKTGVVIASIDRLDFLRPTSDGDMVTLKASLNYVGRTSMEVGIRVEAEDLKTSKVRHTASAYLTLVALDKDRKPMELPPLILETQEEKRRNSEAKARREVRLKERKGSTNGR